MFFLPFPVKQFRIFWPSFLWFFLLKGDPDDSQGQLLHERDVMCCSSEMVKVTVKSSILFWIPSNL